MSIYSFLPALFARVSLQRLWLKPYWARIFLCSPFKREIHLRNPEMMIPLQNANKLLFPMVS